MTLEEQIEYLMESLEQFAQFLMRIQPDLNLCPSTVTVTFLKEMPEQVELCMFCASFCCPVLVNKESAELGEEYEDVTVGVGCGRCSNKNTIVRMFSLFGKLQSQFPAQIQSGGCRFIYVHSHSNRPLTIKEVSVCDGNYGFALTSNNSSIYLKISLIDLVLHPLLVLRFSLTVK